MADAEVLLDYISDLGDGLVALDLQLGELGGGGVLAHDAIFDVVEGEKVTVGFSSVALVGIDLFDFLFCMTTESGAIGEIVGIVDRSWCKGGGQHKTVAGVDRRMFLQTKVGDIIFNRPVGFQVPGELKRIALFIPLALFTVAVFALLFQLILTQGSTGGLNQAGIHGNALVDGKPLLLELAQDLGVDRIHGLLGQPAAEAGEGGVIRSRLAEGKPQKGFEGQAVGDLVFQLGVRGDAEPLLQQQAFEQHQGRVGAGAFLAGAHGVMAEQDGFHARPVDGVVELLHELDAAVLFQAGGHGEVGEIQVAGGLFESHAHLLV